MSIGSWNGRAIVHHKRRKAAKNMSVVDKMLHRADVSCGQEVHGSKEAIIHAFHKQSAEWHLVISPGKTSDAGGVVAAVHGI